VTLSKGPCTSLPPSVSDLQCSITWSIHDTYYFIQTMCPGAG
jgi:hypothetical protein